MLFLLMIVGMGNSNCEGSKSKNSQYQFVDDPPFLIIDAYSQDWISGIQHGGSGTNLYITLGEITESIIIQDFFFRGKMIKPQRTNTIRNQYVGYVKNEVNNNVIMDIDPVKESKNIPPQKIPFQLMDQEAVIGFLLNGVKRYYKLTSIEVKNPIAYPSTKGETDH